MYTSFSHSVICIFIVCKYLLFTFYSIVSEIVYIHIIPLFQELFYP